MFELFPNLPTEIRLLIWREASLSSIRVPQKAVVPFDYRWYLSPADLLKVHSARAPLPINVQCASPWAIHLVNHEAQAVTRELAAEMGLRWATLKPYKHPILTRDFVPEEDYVCLPRQGMMRSVLSELIAIAPPDDDTHWVKRHLSRIHHLLVPAFTAYYNIELIVHAIEDMPNLKRIYVAWGELPRVIWSGLQEASDNLYDLLEIEVQPQWTLEYLPPVPEDYGVPDEHDERHDMGAEEDIEVGMVIGAGNDTSGQPWVEKGHLWKWMSEINKAIGILELGDNFTRRFTDADSTVTLEIVPVKVVVDGDTIPDLSDEGGEELFWYR